MSRLATSYVRGTRTRRRLAETAAALCLVTILLVLGLALLELFLPEFLSRSLWPALGCLGLVLAWQLLRPGVPLADLDRRLGLQDRLLTYWPLRKQGASGAVAPPMLAWLDSDLCQALERLPASRRRAFWKKPLRRLLYLLPLLLLALWLGPWGRLFLDSGQSGGSESAAHTGPALLQEEPPGTSPRQGPGKDSQSPKEREQEEEEQNQGPKQEPEAEEPVGLLELPAKQEFVIPRFVGDGAARRALAHLAELPEALPGRAAAERGSDSRDPTAERLPPKPRVELYRQAAERALRARHVLPEERPFVRRYFRELTAKPMNPKNSK